MGKGQSQINQLTGLRFVAALMVYLSHLQPPVKAPRPVLTFMSSGYSGVTLFFVLSGFVLAYNYYETMSWRTYLKFLLARWGRVYPLYAVLLGWFVVETLVKDLPLKNIWQHVFMLQAWSPDLNVAYGYNSPAWSLSVEAFLYVAFPLVCLLVAFFGRSVSLLISFCVGVFLINGVLAFWFTKQGYGAISWFDPRSAHRWLYVMPLTRLGDFAVGIAAARLYKHWDGTPPRSLSVLMILSVVLAVALMMVKQHLYSAYSFDASYSPLFFVLILGLACSPNGLLSHLLSAKPLVLLGEASYALYLIHQTMIRRLGSGLWAKEISLRSVGIECYIFLLIICLSFGLYSLVEVPARNFVKRKFMVGAQETGTTARDK